MQQYKAPWLVQLKMTRSGPTVHKILLHSIELDVDAVLFEGSHHLAAWSLLPWPFMPRG